LSCSAEGKEGNVVLYYNTILKHKQNNLYIYIYIYNFSLVYVITMNIEVLKNYYILYIV
jgi:hypothetical protein